MSTIPQTQLICPSCVSPGASFSRDDWQARYDEGKTGWDRGEPSPMLRHWLRSGALQPCKILVPGCGRGHEVVALAEAGFDVTAVDFADSAVQSVTMQLHQRGLRAHVVQSDIFTFCQSNRFDAIYEQTSLCAIHPSQWHTYEQLLACWLRTKGKLFALFMKSNKLDGPPFTCGHDTMQRLFAAGWQWHGEPQRVDHPTGMHELACVIERTEAEL